MDTTLTSVTGFTSSAATDHKNSYLVIGLGVLVVVAFVAGFLIGYFVGRKRQRKQKCEDEDQISIETAQSTNDDRHTNYEGESKESVNRFDVHKRPPALPPCPHPTIAKVDQSQDTSHLKTGSENEVVNWPEEQRAEGTVMKANSELEKGTSTVPATESGSDVLSRCGANKCRKSELINYIDSKEINPRVLRIEESNSIICNKTKSRQPTYLSLVTENPSVSLEPDCV